MRAESEGPGRGSTFTVALPADRGGAAAAPARRPRRAPAAARPTCTASTCWWWTTRWTAGRSWRRRSPDTGRRSRAWAPRTTPWRRWSGRVPDAIVCDIEMPGRDGLDLIREIRVAARGARADPRHRAHRPCPPRGPRAQPGRRIPGPPRQAGRPLRARGGGGRPGPRRRGAPPGPDGPQAVALGVPRPAQPRASRSRTTTSRWRGWPGRTATSSRSRGASSSQGTCDGCALGTTGLRDWTLEGIHLCMVRLELMRLNTMPALDPERLRRRVRARGALARRSCARWAACPSR